jgi:EAL domain-containing protein (putative c-di-GMP-specific phosphodiesterase class I)
MARALDQADLDPRRLDLEVPEAALTDGASTAGEALHAMHAMGVRVHLDDFGAGWSALGLLNRFSLDVLDLDRSLVALLPERPRWEVVRAVLTLTKSLGMAVVAEGVETPFQRQALRELGCDMAQGYLFAPPLDELAARAVAARGRL